MNVNSEKMRAINSEKMRTIRSEKVRNIRKKGEDDKQKAMRLFDCAKT